MQEIQEAQAEDNTYQSYEEQYVRLGVLINQDECFEEALNAYIGRLRQIAYSWSMKSHFLAANDGDAMRLRLIMQVLACYKRHVQLVIFYHWLPDDMEGLEASLRMVLHFLSEGEDEPGPLMQSLIKHCEPLLRQYCARCALSSELAEMHLPLP